jgi:hypothetical protein
VGSDLYNPQNRLNWLFWSIYVIDKGLSVRLGRPCIIQDYDITITAPTCDPDVLDSAFKYSILFWMRVARIQGRTYELLYSPAALAQPDQVRASRAQALADELISIIKEKKDAAVCLLEPLSIDYRNRWVHVYTAAAEFVGGIDTDKISLSGS